MKKQVVLTVLLCMCLLGGCKEKEPTAYEKGMKNLEKQNYKEALENFQEAVSDGEDAAKVWRCVGISWSGQGAFDKAEEAFLTALDFTEKSEKTLRTDLNLYLADAQYHQKKYQACIKTCDEILDEKKEKNGYFLRGSAYLHLDEYKKAKKDFSKVILGSKEYEDYLDIYRIYQECDLNADGAEYLEAALEIKAKSSEDFYNRGRVCYYLSEFEKAEKELKTAWEKEYAPAAVYLGKVYVEAKELEKAKDIYTKCLEQKELKAEAYNGLAYCFMELEDYEKALEYIQKGLEIKDGEVNQALLFNEIVVYERNRDFVSAKEKMQQYLALYPADDAAVKENYFLQTR